MQTHKFAGRLCPLLAIIGKSHPPPLFTSFL
jgi:hypothetical protein